MIFYILINIILLFHFIVQIIHILIQINLFYSSNIQMSDKKFRGLIEDLNGTFVAAAIADLSAPSSITINITEAITAIPIIIMVINLVPLFSIIFSLESHL